MILHLYIKFIGRQILLLLRPAEAMRMRHTSGMKVAMKKTWGPMRWGLRRLETISLDSSV